MKEETEEENKGRFTNQEREAYVCSEGKSAHKCRNWS